MFSTLMIPSLSPFDFIGPAGSLYEVVSGIVNRCSFFKADAQQTATCKLIGAGLARAGSFASRRQWNLRFASCVDPSPRSQ